MFMRKATYVKKSSIFLTGRAKNTAKRYMKKARKRDKVRDSDK